MSYFMPTPVSYSSYITPQLHYFDSISAIDGGGAASVATAAFPLSQDMNHDHYLAAVELGLKPVHLACLQGDFEQVMKECCMPAVIDEITEPQNGSGWRLRETPIKLAALMGHLNIVELLMQLGAILGHDGVHASSYASEEGVAARRREFFLNAVRIGREHPDAVNTRKTIYGILSSPGRRSVINAMRSSRADLGYPDYRLAKQGRNIVIYAPVLRVKTDIFLDRSKTIGVITGNKGDGAVLMTAHSGYRLGGDRDEMRCLDTNKWNYIALHHIATLLRFHFPGNRHDNGSRQAKDEHRGRAHAGHCEVLLAAWYAMEMAKKWSGDGNGDGNREADVDRDLDYLLARLKNLKHANLGHERSAIIFIDSQPCTTCLKFINRLFQYTGLWFTVQGAAGVGPTLATKDPRSNARYDTFGDVFEDSENDEELEREVEAVVGLQGPAEIREAATTIMATPAGPDGMHNAMEGDEAVVQAASEAFAQIARSRASLVLPPVPVPGSDTDIDTDAADDIATSPGTPPPAPERIEPITPMRPRMQWPLPENRTPRTPRTGDNVAFWDTPSRKPENHLELLAEYKKKTPVWDFPGYEAARRSQQQHQYHHHHNQQQQSYMHPHPHPHPHPYQPPRQLGTPMSSGSNTMPGVGMGGEAVIVDMMNSSGHCDDVLYPPATRNNELTLQHSIEQAAHTQVHDHDASSSLQSGETFSYSSFAPAMPREKDNLANNEAHHSPDITMQGDSDEDAEGDLDEDYYYVPTQPCSQRSNLGPVTQSEQEEEVGLVSTPHPIPSAATRLEQWRYQPQPQPKPRLERRPRLAVPGVASPWGPKGEWVVNQPGASSNGPVSEIRSLGPRISDEESLRGIERYEFMMRKKGNMSEGQFIPSSFYERH